MVALESMNQKYEGMVVEDFRMVRGGQIDDSLMKKEWKRMFTSFKERDTYPYESYSLV